MRALVWCLSYGPQQERFSQLVFLNLAQAAVCLCWALVWLAVRPAPKGSATLAQFWLPALSNAVGPALGLVALKNIRCGLTRRLAFTAAAYICID